MCTFDFPMIITFLLLARAFVYILVGPAINNVENVLYIVAGHYMCYTGIVMLSHVAMSA